jgi:hypothetical protein
MENIYKQLNKSEQSTKIEKRISPELAALAGWYLSGDVTRGMGQPTPAQQREFERQIQQAMRKKGRRLRKDDAIEKMQQFFKTRDSADTYMRRTPVKNAVQADILIEPFLDKLKIKKLIRAKLNLYPRTNKKIIHGFHTDFKYKHNVVLFYFNTNNGQTLFKDRKITSEENKSIVFDGSLEHSSTTCTDKNYRITLNVNYEF